MKKFLTIAFCLCLYPWMTVAEIVIENNNYFMFYHDLHPSRSDDVVNFLSSTFAGLDPNNEDGNLLSDGSSANNDPAVSKPPLVYPNPFRMEDNAFIGYSLSKAMDVELRVYDMRGYEIVRKNFVNNSNGARGHGDYNKVYLNRDFFKGKDLPAAAYFFVLIGDGEFLAKGKFAVAP